MPLTLPETAAPAAAPLLDTAAFELLPVPVAWCDAQGRWLGCNRAFASYTGCVPDATGAAALPGEVAAELGGAALSLPDLLLAGADLDALAWRATDAQGLPLAGRLSLRCLASWRVLTLLPAADAQPLSPPAASLPGDPAPRGLLDDLDSDAQLAHFGVWTHDLRTGERHWDEQVWRFWGRTPQPGALDLDTALAALHPDDRAETVALHRLSMTVPGRYAHRCRVLDAAGVERRIRTLWQVVADAEGQPVHANGIVFDDTETFRLAQSASDAQSQLNLVLALADIAIWEHEAATGLLRTSTLGWALLGLPPQPQGLALARVMDRLDVDSRKTLQAQLGTIALRSQGVDLDTGGDGPSDLELRCRRPDGQWRALLVRGVRQRDARGDTLGHVGVMLDLSDRFDAQQHALALAQRLEMATAAAGVGVWSMALDDLPRVHWDAQMRRLHGLPADAPAPLLCDYLADHVHPDDRSAVQRSLELLAQRSEGLLDLDLRIVQPDGQVRRLASRTSVRGGPGQRQLQRRAAGRDRAPCHRGPPARGASNAPPWPPAAPASAPGRPSVPPPTAGGMRRCSACAAWTARPAWSASTRCWAGCTRPTATGHARQMRAALAEDDPVQQRIPRGLARRHGALGGLALDAGARRGRPHGAPHRHQLGHHRRPQCRVGTPGAAAGPAREPGQGALPGPHQP